MDILDTSTALAGMADVVKQFLPAYREHYNLSPEQASACQSILQCKTDVLGGHLMHCDDCGHECLFYQSCGNRHCPKCKQYASEQWKDRQLDALLPVPYYHLVFTLPHEFNGWMQLHPEVIYSLLFRTVWDTLNQFSRTHKRLQGQLGVTSVLHTWSQNLSQHVHLHCLIPGIAIKEDQTSFEQTNSQYLYPVNTLKKVFRGKMVSLLRESYNQGKLERITNKGEVKTVLDQVMAKSWVINIKPYLQNPETIVKYLSRYTYRIAISDQRIVSVDEQQVCFRWKDYSDNGKQKIMSLDGIEFLRRFLQHVLPSGFMRIRHYGFLANCIRKKKINLLLTLLRQEEEGCGFKKTAIKSINKTIQPVTCYCPTCKKETMRPVYFLLPKKYRRQ